MDVNDFGLLDALWRRLVGENLSTERLIGRLRSDGGHDILVLSDVELRELVEGRFAGDWHKPAFAFSEMIACYSVDEMAPDQVVAWVFSVLTVADCLGRGETEMEFQFNNFINGFYRVREKLEIDEWIYIFGRLFDHTTPQLHNDRTPLGTISEVLKTVESLKNTCVGDKDVCELLERVETLTRRITARP